MKFCMKLGLWIKWIINHTQYCNSKPMSSCDSIATHSLEPFERGKALVIHVIHIYISDLYDIFTCVLLACRPSFLNPGWHLRIMIISVSLYLLWLALVGTVVQWFVSCPWDFYLFCYRTILGDQMWIIGQWFDSSWVLRLISTDGQLGFHCISWWGWLISDCIIAREWQISFILIM